MSWRKMEPKLQRRSSHQKQEERRNGRKAHDCVYLHNSQTDRQERQSAADTKSVAKAKGLPVAHLLLSGSRYSTISPANIFSSTECHLHEAEDLVLFLGWEYSEYVLHVQVTRTLQSQKELSNSSHLTLSTRDDSLVQTPRSHEKQRCILALCFWGQEREH